MLIEEIVKHSLCHGCGACYGVCKNGAIDLVIDRNRGIYVPAIRRCICDGCGLCEKVCSGASINFTELNSQFVTRSAKSYHDDAIGSLVRFDLSHATERYIRQHASSGGVITAVLLNALRAGNIDGVVNTRMNLSNPLEPEIHLACTEKEIIEAAGSKYCPVPLGVGLRMVRKREGRFAFVGLPCHIHGIRLAQKYIPEFRTKITICIGLFCGHTDSFLSTQYILKKNGIECEEVSSIRYRGGGWPGRVKICLRSGKEVIFPYRDYIAYHERYFFTPARCLTCMDGINRLSDITVMDAWLPELESSEKEGLSLIITRSARGEAICDNAERAKEIIRYPRKLDDLWRSHGYERLSNFDFKAQALVARILKRGIPIYDLNIPKARIINYFRVLIMSLNVWMTTKFTRLNRFKTVVELEMAAFRWFRSKLSRSRI